MLDITKNTSWECQMCGKCCAGPIIDKRADLSSYGVCRFLVDNTCSIYNERPFICRLYPFVADMEKVVSQDGVARPKQAFRLENLKLHPDCPGVGKGKRIYANSRLIRQLDRLAEEFAQGFKESFKKGRPIEEYI